MDSYVNEEILKYVCGSNKYEKLSFSFNDLEMEENSFLQNLKSLKKLKYLSLEFFTVLEECDLHYILNGLNLNFLKLKVTAFDGQMINFDVFRQMDKLKSIKLDFGDNSKIDLIFLQNMLDIPSLTKIETNLMKLDHELDIQDLIERFDRSSILNLVDSSMSSKLHFDKFRPIFDIVSMKDIKSQIENHFPFFLQCKRDLNFNFCEKNKRNFDETLEYSLKKKKKE